MLTRTDSQKGQAIVEFAMVLPIMLIFLLGAIEFGVLFYNIAVITNASREGARAGSKYRTAAITGAYDPLSEEEILSVVRTYLDTRLVTFGNSELATIDPNPTQGTSPEYGGDGDVNVVVHYNHQFLAIPKFFGWGESLHLNAQTVMRLE